MAFTPVHSLPAALAFLAAGALGFLGAVASGVALLGGRPLLARRILLALVAAGGVYLTVLLGVSLASDERVLALGEQKYFCEVDCHLAYSVTGVTTSNILGPLPQEVQAAGTFHIVTVKVWFDERTISSRRAKDMPLAPNPRKLRVVDADGRAYPVSFAGQRALEQGHGRPEVSGALCQPLRPGESNEAQLVFDLPEEVRDPRLLITTADPPAYFIIGHESSWLHKKISFALEPERTSGAKAPFSTSGNRHG